MPELFKNFAATTLAADADSGQTALCVADAGVFPIVFQPANPDGTEGEGSDFFRVVLSNADEMQHEICVCTGRAGDWLEVERGQEGTEAIDWPAGTRVENRLTAGALGPLGSLDALVGADVWAYTMNGVTWGGIRFTRASGEYFDVELPQIGGDGGGRLYEW